MPSPLIIGMTETRTSTGKILVPTLLRGNAYCSQNAPVESMNASDLQITHHRNPEKSDVEDLIEKLKRSNDAFLDRSEGDQGELAVFARRDGEIVGGAHGEVSWGWLDVLTVWLHEDLRGTGLGRKLMDDLEALAIQKGAQAAIVTTWSFQAPEFYKRCGYEEVLVIRDRPPPHRDHFLIKRF